MKKYIVIICLCTFVPLKPTYADLWGGDLPLLTQIVFNTLHTMYELQRQSQLLNDEMAGIKDRIHRIQTIAEVVQPSQWDRWKDPAEAMRRIKVIYHNIPKEYRSEKSDQIEEEISKAMNMISKVSAGANSSFHSGKELERRGADASPGVAQKLTASGVGSLVAMEAQTQVIQSHIVSLLAQQLADSSEKETRSITNRGQSFNSVSSSLKAEENLFSSLALGLKVMP
ncbi:MAG: hypothetical protein JNL01_14285 [Bdellovibrionales bacterium]|nr:hypothetical protein [Bdellovibrionales bacterium]